MKGKNDDWWLTIIQLISIVYLMAPDNGLTMMNPDPFWFYDFPIDECTKEPGGIYWQTYLWMIGVHVQFVVFAYWKCREDRRASMLAFLVLMVLNALDFFLSYNTTEVLVFGLPLTINTLAVAVLGLAIIYDRWK